MTKQELIQKYHAEHTALSPAAIHYFSYAHPNVLCAFNKYNKTLLLLAQWLIYQKDNRSFNAFMTSSDQVLQQTAKSLFDEATRIHQSMITPEERTQLGQQSGAHRLDQILTRCGFYTDDGLVYSDDCQTLNEQQSFQRLVAGIYTQAKFVHTKYPFITQPLETTGITSTSGATSSTSSNTASSTTRAPILAWITLNRPEEDLTISMGLNFDRRAFFDPVVGEFTFESSQRVIGFTVEYLQALYPAYAKHIRCVYLFTRSLSGN
jgi:hypothetical protein